MVITNPGTKKNGVFFLSIIDPMQVVEMLHSRIAMMKNEMYYIWSLLTNTCNRTMINNLSLFRAKLELLYYSRAG